MIVQDRQLVKNGMAGLRVVDAAPTLRSKVSEALREAIADGRLAQGQRLIEREMCEVFKVSRPSLREALRELEAEGYIDNPPNRGPRVKVANPKALRDGYEALLALDSLAARLAAERADAADIDRLKERLEAMQKALIGQDTLLMLLARDAFFDEMLAIADNEVLTGMLRPLRRRLTQTRSASLDEPGRPRAIVTEASAIYAAIAKRDAPLTHALCCATLTAGYDAALNVLNRREQAREPTPC